MFNFLVQNKKGEVQNYLDIISVNVKKITLSKMAIEKAVGMIAKAIAKSEFIVERNGARVKDDVYWLLNVRPNYNETATDFWIKVIRKLLLETECVVCHIAGGLYLADSFETTDSVMLPQMYRNIKISSNEKSMYLSTMQSANDVLHLKAHNKKIRKYLEKILNIYDETVSAMCIVQKLSNTPKFNLKMDTLMPVIKRKKEDGTEIKLTLDQYKEEIVRLIESDNIEILTSSNSLLLEQFKIENTVKSEEIVKLTKEVFEETAAAFDIPKAVFLGEITEKADSTNEFITYACSWIVELINDSMNAKLVGKNAYINGEKLWIDMTRYKHRDIIDCAIGLEKLRGIGFNFDEIRELVGREALNTEFSQRRVITKNFGEDIGGGSGEKIEN